MAEFLQSLRVDRSFFSDRSLTDPSDEIQLWKTKTPAERLQALEAMRQIAFGYDPAIQRLQKIMEVVDLEHLP